MKKFLHVSAIAVAMLSFASSANATIEDGRIYIAGDATPYGWSLDDAQALLQKPGEEKVFAGTIYLKNEGTFKFLETTDFGNTEIGLASDVENTVVLGEVAIAEGSNDEGYKQASVADAANYYIEVNLNTMKMDVQKSEYQVTEIKVISMFLIGSATAGGWSVDQGTPLYQKKETPYIYAADVDLKADGSFKIATTIKGGGTFDSKYYYFRDADDAGKISTNGDGDNQWSVAADHVYAVAVNTVADTISIEETNNSAILIETFDNPGDEAAEYYTLQGIKVVNPEKGLYIVKTGNKVSKVIL